MDIQWLSEFVTKYFSAGYGVPTADQWPVFVLSKLALVLMPFFAVRLFRSYVDNIELAQSSERSNGAHLVRAFFERFIAHAMFYVGMGFPIIGLEAVMDLHRLIGFTLVNMFIHEVVPKIVSETRFKRLVPEWQETLGINFIVENVTMEATVFLDKKGRIRVEESPHSKFKNFIKRTIHKDDDKGAICEVVLRRFFVPKQLDGRFVVRKQSAPSVASNGKSLGEELHFDLGDLAAFATPVYINSQGRRSWLWQPYYWTKFFNEVGGKSYVDSPFSVVRKFFLVVLGTPIAFSVGNMLVHFHYGSTLNFHPLIHFDYGIIFAFTIGGMYGASVFSTLIELTAWKIHLLQRKQQLFVEYLRRPGKLWRTRSVRSHSPYLSPELFGAMLERQNKTYRRFRLIAGGLLMGGICSWGVTYFFGMTFERYIDRQVRPAVVATVVPRQDTYPGVHVDETFVGIAKAFADRDRKLFQTNSNLAGSW